nr:MAG: RNA-dependent RNA polymerase [Narnaviridae sp.]
MIPHVQTWLPTGTIVDDGSLADRERDSTSLEAYPDPDSWFAGGLSRDNKLFSLLDVHINVFAPASRQGRRRLRHIEEVPRDAKRGFAGYYLSHGLLSKDIAHRLSKLPVSELERIERIWLAVEDSLLLSSPESFLLDDGDFVKTQFRWVVSKCVTSGYQEMLADYKKLMMFVKANAIKSDQYLSLKGPCHFPGFEPDGSFKKTGNDWLDRVINRGLKSKGEGTRLAHYCSTRGLPPPTGEMIQDSLRKHRMNLSAPAADIPPERMLMVRMLARRIGRRINRTQAQKDLANPEHVSLTNSSSFAYSRTDGGRAAEVQAEFAQWANSSGQSRTHVLDYPIVEGVNWRTTLCIPRDYDQTQYEFGDPLPTGGLLGMRRAGYDSNLGFQILQCAAEAGQKRELLDENYNLVGFPQVRASVSAEPGGKARIVTANEWWVTILLQPLGHLLTSLLEEIPSARAGLSRSEPAWEWVEDLRLGKTSPVAERLYRDFELLTSDLSEATDHCHRELSRAMLEGFFEGVSLDTSRGYLKLSIDLLVGRKMLHSPGLNLKVKT